MFMLPKMTNQMDSIEARLAVVDASARHKLREFREMMVGDFRVRMMTEFAKMKER